MKAIYIQRALAFIFFSLGSWCLLMPATVEWLVLKPDYYIGNVSSHLLLGCFGAQAVLVGTVILSARFKASTFLIFGLVGSVPFFVFNFYFYFIKEMFTDWMLLDFVGNLGILLCGIWGYRLSKQEHHLS
ncbi:MAG: hypothetical protein DWP95_12990 [Proteobacteria bacterium]|nr:MAG: hypothetical protein DWP95_12990 [Pseudomonadota bacterium]